MKQGYQEKPTYMVGDNGECPHCGYSWKDSNWGPVATTLGWYETKETKYGRWYEDKECLRCKGRYSMYNGVI